MYTDRSFFYHRQIRNVANTKILLFYHGCGLWRKIQYVRHFKKSRPFCSKQVHAYMYGIAISNINRTGPKWWRPLETTDNSIDYNLQWLLCFFSQFFISRKFSRLCERCIFRDTTDLNKIWVLEYPGSHGLVEAGQVTQAHQGLKVLQALAVHICTR